MLDIFWPQWGGVLTAPRGYATAIACMLKILFQLLGVRGYELKKRGIVDVKGKGLMETYFVIGRQLKRPPNFQRQPSHYSSLAAVVYALAQTRRKHTGNTRKLVDLLLKNYFRTSLLFSGKCSSRTS